MCQQNTQHAVKRKIKYEKKKNLTYLSHDLSQDM